MLAEHEGPAGGGRMLAEVVNQPALELLDVVEVDQAEQVDLQGRG